MINIKYNETPVLHFVADLKIKRIKFTIIGNVNGFLHGRYVSTRTD